MTDKNKDKKEFWDIGDDLRKQEREQKKEEMFSRWEKNLKILAITL